MATRTPSTVVSLTCPVCDITVSQPPGTRRTICPHCGHFYDTSAAGNPHLLGSRPSRGVGGPGSGSGGPAPQALPPPPTRKLPALDKDAEKDKPNGRLQSLANFFQNLGPNRRNGKPEGFDNVGEADNPASASHGGTTSSRCPPKDKSQPTLPPLSPESRGRLTAATGGNSPREPSYTSSQGRPSSRNGTRPASGNGRRTGRPPSGQSHGTSASTENHGNPVGIQSPYPVRTKTLEDLRVDFTKAKEEKDWKTIQDFYTTTFDSVLELNALFKRDPSKEYKSTEDSGLKLEFIYAVYDTLENVPPDIQKTVLKAIINSLLQDKRPHTKDDLRAYLILLLNPQFRAQATYVIFAHLLRQMASLNDHDHHYLVHWFKRIHASRFQALVQKLHNFISCRLFPPKPEDFPPMTKCTWWIPSATKVLALLNAANNLCRPISYMEFYNNTLDLLDLMAEYYTWQNPTAHPGFSFCQYPFILSITAKRTVLQRDSEQQMIIMARRSLVAKVQRRELPEIGMLFLNITVRRSHLVSDSLNEVARKQHDLKKKLKVTFAGEPGLDMGGLTKEWFLLLIRQIFQQEYGMFTYDKKACVFWFSSAPCENSQEFNLVGVLMGLAVYNSITLDIHFPAICYKKLLSPAVVPYNNPKATVGMTNASLKDLTDTLPDLAHGLKELLDYEGDVEEDFGLSFQVTHSEFNSLKTHILKTGGENIPVTNKNRKEYVQLYVDYLLNKSVYNQFQAFYHGFHSVCASNALIMLRPEEVELLVCGNPNLRMEELKKVTVYDGYTPQDHTIKAFWDFVLAMPKETQKRLLLFATGSDRIPVGGMSEMQFKITKVENTSMLPMAHTCFNQLVLPAYKGKKALKQKLMIAVQNAEGFGLE